VCTKKAKISPVPRYSPAAAPPLQIVVSSDLPPPSPAAEKPTASQEQAGQASTGESGRGRRLVLQIEFALRPPTQLYL
jgi:hypothetical protein